MWRSRGGRPPDVFSFRPPVVVVVRLCLFVCRRRWRLRVYVCVSKEMNMYVSGMKVARVFCLLLKKKRGWMDWMDGWVFAYVVWGDHLHRSRFPPCRLGSGS